MEAFKKVKKNTFDEDNYKKKYLKDHALGDNRKIVEYLLYNYNPAKDIIITIGTGCNLQDHSNVVFKTLVKCDKMHDPAKIAIDTIIPKEILKKKLNERLLLQQKSVINYFLFRFVYFNYFD